MTIAQKITFLISCLPMLMLGFAFSVHADTPVLPPVEQTGPLNGNAEQTGPESRIEPVSLENPLRVNSLEELLVAILNIFMVLMIPIVVFFIIWAGFKYVTAQGNPGQIEEATTTFTYAVIGGVLILAAVAIAEIIRNTVDSFAA